MGNLKQLISNRLYHELYCVDCDTCQHKYEDSDSCETCLCGHPNWSISKQYANELAEVILDKVFR